MRDKKDTVLYVGKAKNLKKRLSSYFQRQLDSKTIQLIKQVHAIEVTLTRNEREALLLENNLIKDLQPKYNIIFRDDKSYPYLYLSTSDEFPRLSFYRGEKKEKGRFYGPYPSSSLAREALTFLQTLFRLRQCDNAFFKSRKRPCLQYQIKRCTAPCVGYIDEKTYAQDVLSAKLFLENKNDEVIKRLEKKMEEKSDNFAYEEAAVVRDQIVTLRRIQQQQIIIGKNVNTDILGIAVYGESACIYLLVIRQGRMLGSRAFFPKSLLLIEEEEGKDKAGSLLERFIVQHYVEAQEADLEHPDYPKDILIGEPIPQRAMLASLLSKQSGHTIKIKVAHQGKSKQWLTMANTNAKSALKSHHKIQIEFSSQFEVLQRALDLVMIPSRVECFDVSHSKGEATVASLVVFNTNGPVKTDYRRFNIRLAKPGDDYGALTEALTRHYTRLKAENQPLPDILLIDGGKGQLKQAETVLTELQVTGVKVIGVSKGRARKPGQETLYLSSKGDILPLENTDPAFHFIQRVRDEAHRFALGGHRGKRLKARLHSRLEDIPGIGKVRRLKLLKHFGGLQEILAAGVEDLVKVDGFSQKLAEEIYTALHGSV